MDKSGNITAGYSVSSNTIFPGIRYASRQPNDPLNRLGAEISFQDGTGTQRCVLPNGQCECPLFDNNGNPVLDAHGKVKCDTLTRWGDYSTLSIDPTDDCTFWYTSEYGEETGAFKWRTRIGSFRLPSCH